MGNGTQDINRPLVDMRHNASNVLRLNMIRLHCVQQRIGGRVGVTARGMVLKTRFCTSPACPEAID